MKVGKVDGVKVLSAISDDMFSNAADGVLEALRLYPWLGRLRELGVREVVVTDIGGCSNVSDKDGRIVIVLAGDYYDDVRITPAVGEERYMILKSIGSWPVLRSLPSNCAVSVESADVIAAWAAEAADYIVVVGYCAGRACRVGIPLYSSTRTEDATYALLLVHAMLARAVGAAPRAPPEALPLTRVAAPPLIVSKLDTKVCEENGIDIVVDSALEVIKVSYNGSIEGRYVYDSEGRKCAIVKDGRQLTFRVEADFEAIVNFSGGGNVYGYAGVCFDDYGCVRHPNSISRDDGDDEWFCLGEYKPAPPREGEELCSWAAKIVKQIMLIMSEPAMDNPTAEELEELLRSMGAELVPVDEWESGEDEGWEA